MVKNKKNAMKKMLKIQETGEYQKKNSGEKKKLRDGKRDGQGEKNERQRKRERE